MTWPGNPPDLWRRQRDQRRRKRAKYAPRERLARRLREAWPEGFGRLSDAQEVEAVEAAARRVRPAPVRGTHAWARMMSGKSGQAYLRGRLRRKGIPPRDYYSWLAGRSHGSREPSPLRALPPVPARPQRG